MIEEKQFTLATSAKKTMTDVFLLSIDAVRGDCFTDAYFSKCWSDYFEDFVLFDNAYSNGVATPLAFPSIHTGYPVVDDGTLPGDVPTVAECYDGYTFAITNNPQLRSDRGYDRGFDSFSRVATSGQSSSTGVVHRFKSVAKQSQTIWDLYDRFWRIVWRTTPIDPDLSPQYFRTAACVLSVLKSSLKNEPGFYWVHLMDPHHPYYPHKITDREVEVEYTDSDVWQMNRRVRGPGLRSMGLDNDDADLPPPSEAEIEFCRSMYDEILRYIDRMLCDFFDHLKTTDRWDESMIVVLSDHGEAFGEKGVFQHDWTANPIDELVRVPLAVKYPENSDAGEVYTHPVQTGDLFATLVDVLDWDRSTPPHTRPFSDPGSRPILSKSNNALRVTTEQGYAIQRGDSIVEQVGDPDAEAVAILRESSLPRVDSLSGEVPGLSERARQDLEDRLEHLGYR